jgi:hypothetical protein
MRGNLVIRAEIEKDLIGGWAYFISMGGKEWNYGICALVSETSPASESFGEPKDWTGQTPKGTFLSSGKRTFLFG